VQVDLGVLLQPGERPHHVVGPGIEPADMAFVELGRSPPRKPESRVGRQPPPRRERAGPPPAGLCAGGWSPRPRPGCLRATRRGRGSPVRPAGSARTPLRASRPTTSRTGGCDRARARHARCGAHRRRARRSTSTDRLRATTSRSRAGRRRRRAARSPRGRRVARGSRAVRPARRAGRRAAASRAPRRCRRPGTRSRRPRTEFAPRSRRKFMDCR
jgi:hypothetical protein